MSCGKYTVKERQIARKIRNIKDVQNKTKNKDTYERCKEKIKILKEKLKGKYNMETKKARKIKISGI